MRILMLTERFPPEVRASGHLFHELAVGLVERGHEVAAVTRMPSDYVPSGQRGDQRVRPRAREQLDAVDVIRVKSFSALSRAPVIRAIDHLALGMTFALAARRWRTADIVLIYSPPLPLAMAGYFYKLWIGAPYVLNLHDFYPQTAIDLGLLKNRVAITMAERLEKVCYRSAAHIIVPAPRSQEILVKRKGLDVKKVSLIPNWVDVDRILPAPRENGFRRTHGLSDFFVISYAGVMGFAQDLTSVMECARMLEHKTDIVFLLVGEGVYRGKWEQLASGLRNVRFLPMQSKDQYFELLRASDVCLVPLTKTLKSPAIPGKIQSIMAVSRPIVAIVDPMGDAADLVARSEAGLIVPPEQPDELMQVILRLYDDREMRERFGANGRAYSECHFSFRRAITSYEGILEQVLSEAGSQSD